VLDSRLATAGSTLAQLKNIDLKPIEDALRSLEDQRSKLADFETVARTLEQGDAMAERARFASKQYESVVQQADQARRHFGESLLKGASAIDALEHRLASITDTLDKASSQADAIHARSPAEAQARALADHLREMGQWLAGIIAQANESGTNLSAALDRLPTARRLGA
jgi:septal ring factor EnvC (AmiA/AmiB activator)